MKGYGARKLGEPARVDPDTIFELDSFSKPISTTVISHSGAFLSGAATTIYMIPALFEPDAVIDIGDGTFLRGKEAIHEFFTKLRVTGFGPEGRKFELGDQRPALICGDLALTSTRSRNGDVTSEVARRHDDGTWLWVIDRYSVSW